MNGSDLNRLLLHNNLPGIESLRARRVKGGDGAVCRSCLVDLTRFEGGTRDEPVEYELCEDCGCVFIEAEAAQTPDPKAAEQVLVGFFRRFQTEKGPR
jgi:hypothetical protein